MVGPSISVVIPTAGRPRYLRGCLAALARVEPPPGGFEVVVVNDGGGAEIDRVLSEAPRSLELRATIPQGTGPSAARNAGAEVALGTRVAFTDDDCEPRRGWLGALANALAANPEAAVGGRTVNGVPGDRGAVASQIVVDALRARLNRDPAAPGFYASSNLALPREGFLAVGGFDPGFRYAEDREFCERWLRSGRRLAPASDAVVDHMRTLTLGEFWRQHHGYGRGAHAFARVRRTTGRGGGTLGVLRAMISLTRGAEPGERLALAGYAAISQLATASGYARDALRERRERPRSPIRGP